MADLLVRTGPLTAAEAMELSQNALDVPLGGDAELTVAEITSVATVLGAFQRGHGLPDDAERLPLTRRGSGGPFVTVGPGTLHVVLALSHPAALVACDPPRLINRYVRPLLKALTRCGALAHYFGRDWVSVGHRPVCQVGFAHDSVTSRTVFEAIVAVTSELAPAHRPSFMGKEPGTLASVTGRSFSLGELASAITRAYSEAGTRDARCLPLVPPATLTPVLPSPPWAATVTEAIGELGAGADGDGVFRLGGDLLASRDALTRLASRAAAIDPEDVAALGRAVDEELAAPGVALEGVRDLASVREVLSAARKP